MTAQEVLAALAVGAGALTSAGVIWTKAIRPVVDSTKLIASLPAKVDSIKAELRPNGGATLRDSLDRVERRMQVVDERGAIRDARDRMLLNQEQFAYFECDADGSMRWITRAAMRWTGRAIEDMSGNGWLHIVWPGDRPSVSREWEQAVDSESVLECRHGIIDHQGQRLPVYTRAWPVLHSGAIVAWIGTIHREGAV